MEVAIVDDEKVIREQIKKLTVKYEPDCNVIAYETGEELLAEGKKLDVVFTCFKNTSVIVNDLPDVTYSVVNLVRATRDTIR